MIMPFLLVFLYFFHHLFEHCVYIKLCEKMRKMAPETYQLMQIASGDATVN
jgi:hypothetical protein